MNDNNMPPKAGRRFYFIMDRGDGFVDIILYPRVVPMTTPDGFTDYDITGALIVRKVEPAPGLEDDIRARFYAWCEAGEPIEPTKGDESMDKDNMNPENELEEINPEEIEFEPEGEPEEPQLDAVFLRDGKGRVYQMEVPDDD